MALTVKKASEQFLSNLRLLVLSPPKHGKTLLAATLSDKFVGWNRPKGEIIVLDDLLWVAFDPNALEGLILQGYDAPIIDYSGASGPALQPAINALMNDLLKEVQTRKTKVVVLDTVSMLDKYLNEWFGRTYDKWDLFRAVNNWHTRLVSVLNSLPCTVVVLAHAKADMTPTETQGQINKKATDLPGSGGISSQITGQAKGTYEGIVSLILPLQAKAVDLGGGKVETQRVLYPLGGNGFEGAGRYIDALSKEEPADLGLLVKKIEAFVKAKWAAKQPAT